ncbi:hypothetical protein [Serratia proteamaculans]|uniref:hypothetical protein n=1 Tax=Serratia proteamaculans TaxID=28151 RepID=UPI00217C6D65|nr:hypothetical protein [Serratia proteamaculans]CAI1765662.1 Uncharacterised protein [Serratia proteamaculans]
MNGMWNSAIKQGLRAGKILALGALLSGCVVPQGKNGHKPITPTTVKSTTQTPAATQSASEAERLAQCQRELAALQVASPARYQQRKAEFDRLMAGAAQYGGIRTSVNTETQDTLDSLYRYKVGRLCAEISQDVLSGLMDTGEQGK